MPATDTIDVVFPPSIRPKVRKLVIRNNSTKLLVAKIKTISTEKKDNLAAVVPPNASQFIALVFIPNNYTKDPELEDNLPQLHLKLKDKDQLEIYCRPLFLDGSEDLVRKNQVKYVGPAGGKYRITYTKLQNAEELSKLGKREKAWWWRDRLTEIAQNKQDRLEELTTWVRFGIDEPHMLAYKLKVVKDAKRFCSPTMLVEIPGKASLVESVPYPVENFDDSDTLTAHHVSSGKFLGIDNFTLGTSTAMPFKAEQLMQLAPSNSACHTARKINGQLSCDWIAQWLNWFLPLRVD